MSEPIPEEFPPITIEPDAVEAADVAFVVPASAYDSIATDDELSRMVEPQRLEPLSDVPPDLSPILKGIEGIGQMLGGKLEALATLFDREIRAESTREKVVDRLHAELQEYKQDLLLNILRPIFVDLIQLHDDVGKIAASLRSEGDMDGGISRFRELVIGVQQGIEDILYRQGVEPFSHDSDNFDARRQRAVSTVPTEDASLGRKVAERFRKGFISGEKIIRPEVVSVYVVRNPVERQAASS
ncbi:MAG: hypothetical protein JWN86_4479 [Planctomycetota bacterium]|nr:hypothetical protein [Planctomycetota bacterium]